MTRLKVEEFKSFCREFLSKQGIAALRPYGRFVGVAEPTAKSKNVLIDEIIAILAQEMEPTPRSPRGAPIKDDFVDPYIKKAMESICDQYPVVYADNGTDESDIRKKLKELSEQNRYWSVEDSKTKELSQNGQRKIYKGQMEWENGIPMLLPMDLNKNGSRILLSEDMLKVYDLREGDVITCFAQRTANALVATTILTVDEMIAEKFSRRRFEELPICFPKNRISFYGNERAGAVVNKCFEWLTPIGKGQRVLVSAPPKAGKSTLLLEMATSIANLNENMKVLVLLIDQSHESVGRFRDRVRAEEIICTTYEDAPEQHVLAAEFLIKRAKRYAEAGKDVCLIVDSFNALARAYDQTALAVGGRTLACGLENKTIQYIKKYFGTARCLSCGCSITMIGALATETGDPADDVLKAELTAVGNLKVELSDALAKKRIYPAIDFLNTQGNGNEGLLSFPEKDVEGQLRAEYIPKHGDEAFSKLLSECVTWNDLQTAIFPQYKDHKK